MSESTTTTTTTTTAKEATMNTKPATFAQIALFARLIEERRFHNGQTVPEALGDRDFEAWFAVLLNDGDRMSEYTTWLLDLYPAA